MRDVADQATGLGGTEDAFMTRAAVDLDFSFHRYLSGSMEAFAAIEATGTTDTEDLQQLFLDFDQFLGDYTLRLGRMQFDLGDGRVVSSIPWLLERNSFDGLQVSSMQGGWDLRGWHTIAANGPSDTFDDTFTGFYGSTPLGKDEVFETYFLRRAQTMTDLEEFTAALRWAGETNNGLVWDLFGAYQDGTDAGLEVVAYAIAASLRKKLDYGHGVGMDLAIAKGNDDNTSHRKRYAPVYIDQHKFNGRADVVAFSNLIDIAFLYWLDWNERWSFHVDYHDFSRQSDSDLVYLGYDVTGVTPASTSTNIGRELDIYCEGVLSDNFAVDFGGAFFSPQASLPHDEEQLWLYIQFVLNF
ncbi:MAG: alginate export family protein [Planctomycetota bacterium]